MRAIVIGSGVAGLASAMRLQTMGCSVTVFEANSYPGGKLTSIELGGYRFDAGPSLFTMPERVLDLFRAAGKDPAGRFAFKRKKIGCHYFYPDGTFLRAFTDPEQLAKEAERVLAVPAERVRHYLEHSESVYNHVGRTFLEKPLNRRGTWMTLGVARALLHLGQFDLGATLRETNLRRLQEPRLVQDFDRMATYNGSSPYRAPGILAIIPHLEHDVGTFVPDGGMIAITRSLYAIANEFGVTFEFDALVTRIIVEHERALGVLSRNERIDASQSASPVSVSISVGIAVCGFAHFLVHEVFIHRRLKSWRDTKSVYWLAVRKAHMQHHRHVDREDGECFGMLWVAHRYIVDARRALGWGTP